MGHQYSINQEHIEKVEHFCSPGSIEAAKLAIHLEMERRILAAEIGFYRLRECVFENAPENKDGCVQGFIIANTSMWVRVFHTVPVHLGG